LGGTSLALINVVVEMGKRFAIPLDPGIVARGATVRALTEAVKEKMGAVNQQPPSMEQAILEIWSSALGENQIGEDDDFFELGGTSLALINVVVEMGKRFAIPLDTGIVARGATVRALTEAVKEKMGAVNQQPPSMEQAILEIWSSALGENQIGEDDDFFELGGTSLALINVVVEMGKRFAIPLDTGIVARGATVRALTEAVKEKMGAVNQQPPSMEQAILEIWSSALGENQIGEDDDFFELGGTSLALINVVVEMGKRFAIPLDPGIVARGATVRALTEAVKEKMGAVNQQPPSMEQAILEIWSSALGENQIGEDDDFFELGGTSLALINVVVEMGKRFAIPLDTGIVARGATVRALTEAVKEKMGAVNQQPPSMEQAILEIWSSALGENQIGEDDDFFELGGTSLALINVVVEMGKRFAIPLDTGIVARGATVRALTEAVKEKMGAVNQQPPSMEQAILEIWSSALGENQIGEDDDFFELGGTSLALINVVVEMGKRFAIPLDTCIVARGATVRALTEAVKEKMGAVNQQPPSMEQAILEIWSSALGENQIGEDDDFFELGGTSLALINVVVEMGKRFAIPLDTGIVARGATV